MCRLLLSQPNAMVGDQDEFLAAGMDDYIAKPLKRKGLKKVIERCLAKNMEIGISKDADKPVSAKNALDPFDMDEAF